MGAADDADGGFGNFEVFRDSLNKSLISLAVVRFSTKINSQFAWSGFDDFLLRGAGLDGDLIMIHFSIISGFIAP